MNHSKTFLEVSHDYLGWVWEHHQTVSYHKKIYLICHILNELIRHLFVLENYVYQ